MRDGRSPNLKWFAGALLVVSFLLPTSRCADPFQQETDASRYVYRYPYQAVPHEPFWGPVVVLAYFWPVMTLALRASGLGARHARALAGVELALCLGSAYMVYLLNLFSETWYGTWVSAFGLCSYFALALITLVAGKEPHLALRRP